MEKPLNQQLLVRRGNKIKMCTAVHYNKFERTPRLAYNFPMFICENGFHVHCSLFYVWHFVNKLHNFAHIYNIQLIQHPNSTYSMLIWIFFHVLTTEHRMKVGTKYEIRLGFVLISKHSLHFSIHCSGNEHTITSNINKIHKYSRFERFSFLHWSY